MRNSIFIFILPSEEDCNLTPEENLEPNSAGLKSLRTRGVWHKSLEESHSAQIKEKSLLGYLVCSEETQKEIIKPDIFRIRESEGITEIGTLYKVSPSKFVLVFGSKTAKEKLQGTKISYISAVLAIQKFLLISANELVLSEMGQNLFL